MNTSKNLLPDGVIPIFCSDRCFEQVQNACLNINLTVSQIKEGLPSNILHGNHPILMESGQNYSDLVKDFWHRLKKEHPGRGVDGNSDDLIEKLTAWGQHTAVDSDHPPTILILGQAKRHGPIGVLLERFHYHVRWASMPFKADPSALNEVTHIFIPCPKEEHDTYSKIKDLIDDQLHQPCYLFDLDDWKYFIQQFLIRERKIEDPHQHDDEDGENKPGQQTRAFLDILVTFSSFNQERDLLRRVHKDNEQAQQLLNTHSFWAKRCLEYQYTTKKPLALPKINEKQREDEALAPIFKCLEAQNDCALQVLAARYELTHNLTEEEEKAAGLPFWGSLQKSARPFLNHIRFRNTLKKQLTYRERQYTQSEAFQKKKASWFDSKGNKLEAEVMQKLQSLESDELQQRLSVLNQELSRLEKHNVNLFWFLYQNCALAWVNKSERGLFHRCFLRTGFTGSPLFATSPEIKHQLKEICQTYITEWTFDSQEDHDLYVDEALDFFAQGLMPPAYDEDLELNGRLSDEWHAARDITRYARFKRESSRLEIAVNALQKEIDDQSSQEEGLSENDRTLLNVKKKNLERLQNMRDLAVSNCDDAQPGWELAFDKFPLEHWVKKEAKHIRRQIKLANRLHEPLIPEFLVENGPIKDDFSLHRDLLRKENQTIESWDRSLYERTLIEHKNRKRALNLRCAPPILILPGGGLHGLCLNGPDDTQDGILVVPMLITSRMSNREALIQIFSDYRWDKSMAKAGNDWITSDSVVGAYSRFRWNMRNKDQNVREKAGMYKEESDKINWRRHYKWYVTSAEDQGKLLFFRNKELYAEIVKHIVLPEGVEKLER